MLRIGESDKDMLSRMKLYEWYDERKVKSKKILLVGAGALGNEAAKNLVLSGYKKITIVDMDYVVHSNLSRCIFFRKEDAEKHRYKAKVMAARLSELADVSIDFYVDRVQNIDENLMKEYDIILGCLDNIEARLYINARAYHYGIPYIDGATHGMVGKVQVIIPPITPCLQCSMNVTHSKVMEKRFSCTGKDVSYFEPNMPSDINTTSIIAAIQVQEALKITHGMENYIKNIFYFDGSRNFSSILEISINPKCPNHKV
ncbi:MAG: ThiF family adenylyltransferase [Thermoplasmata archaeon]|nr:ThiF family adenylyltransferase [Thermoplasmata archaeon]